MHSAFGVFPSVHLLHPLFTLLPLWVSVMMQTKEYPLGHEQFAVYSVLFIERHFSDAMTEKRWTPAQSIHACVNPLGREICHPYL